ncbi:MAG: 50S ribosomal protein L10 [Anaerolineales bacterium]|nr:50S ribosomal protein L10 [Anaerolineales bacterium]
MAISKARKLALAARYAELLKGSQGIVLTAFSGARVSELEALRRKVRENGGEFHVVKNRLLQLAMKEAGISVPAGGLQGTTAVGFAGDDVPAVAKAIVDAARTSEALKVKGGMVSGVTYGAAEIERLADLPPMPVLRAQLLGVIMAPASRIAGVMAGSVRQLASVVKAYSEKAPAAA